MAKLRIGTLPDDRPVKRTITFTAAQDNLLRDYAAAIVAQDGLAAAPPVEKLVPAIIERFIMADRGFRRRKGASETINQFGSKRGETNSD
ncbi:DUF2274 domain-containing protein [Acidiphilium acidophilum]|uniref:DUF2274 domain-containing protein n=1 Tax=Acidiphilium acidophilum TaxID=76588 RepID=UPI002E8E72CB|nr:DUF2274 domain-containing protein [Acidiphilium acidophilum]